VECPECIESCTCSFEGDLAAPGLCVVFGICRGADFRALANARSVSPSASYLKRHQVTKCPGSWLGPRSSGSLTSACTQVAICVVWDIAHLEAKSRANAAFDFYAIPVGDAGGHDGTGRDSDEALRHLADEPSDPPLRCCRTTSASPIGFRVQLEIWIPPNSGAADTALANARPVSPSASYLKRHQVTKCPGSWLGPPPSAIHGGGRLSRHPCRSAHSTSPTFGLHPSRDWCRLGHRALRSKIKINSEHGCPS
jgi:hypothetical protein